MKFFIGSTSIFSIIIITSIILDHSTKYYKNYYSNKYRIIVENTSLIGQHPTYASIFLGVSLLFLAFLFFNKTKSKLKNNYWIYFISTILISTLLIMLSSKVVIISLFIITLLYFTKKVLFTGFNKKIILYIGVVLTLILLIFNFNRRMNEMFKFKTYTKVDSNFSNSYRVNIYKCAEYIIKKNWLIGVGVGDAQDALNLCYKNKSELLLKKTYNSHNQYLDVWIKIGLIGLVIFLGFLSFNFINAYNNKNYILLLLLMFYAINFLTENLLVRQSGVILFTFFINFLSSLNKNLYEQNNN
jgi:O-antigen ligase